MRKLPLGPLIRVQRGWKAGLAAGAATVGFGRTVLAFTSAADLHFTPQVLVIAASSFLLVGVVAAYVHGRSKLFPDVFVDEIGSEPSFRAELCNAVALHEACDLTRESYRHEYVGHQVAEQWRIKNPRAFVQIKAPDNRLCAAFGVLALRESFMDQFIKGRVCDTELGGDDIYSWAESTKCLRIYLSGVVVLGPSTIPGSKRARVMMWVMLEYMRQLYGLKTHRQLYAVAVTKESIRLMTDLGFVVETPAAGRADKCDLYRYDLTEASWRTLLCRVGDLSPMCSCNFEPSNHGDAPRTSVLQEPEFPKTILFVAGDRGGSQRNQLQIPREFASIQEALRSSKHRDAFLVAPPILAATRQTLVEAYRHRPLILHFSGHGDNRSLSFIFDQGLVVNQTQIFAEQLAAILRNFPNPVRLCVLNTCESAAIARHLVDERVVEAAVGWPAKLADATAITFCKTLYECLGDGLALSNSVNLATQSCGANEAPIVCTAEGVDGDTIIYV